MNIALIGYGKMGKAIEQEALQRGHKIVLKITSANKDSLSNGDLKAADVAIEFSRPESAVENIHHCFSAGIPVVVGTTGWLDRLKDVKDACFQQERSLLYASNFSVGVNLFFAINKYAAKLMNAHSEYDVKVEETHHVHKLDAPSGTAITTAEGIMEAYSSRKKWVNEESSDPSVLPIISHRIDEVPGTHNVIYSSSIDAIELIHTAHSRKGFAVGAVVAAEWLQGKKGVFTMQDVLNLS